MFSNLHIEHRDDGIAIITIDQPNSSANILTETLWHELDDALTTHCHTEAIILQSAKPKITIAGADLKLLREASGPNDPKVRAFIELGLRVLDKLANHPKSTCMFINGILLGGGLEVALACDYRVPGSNPNIVFGMPEINLGLIPGWGGTQRLPRLIGWHGTKMLFSGKSIGIEDAESLGLVNFRNGVDDTLENVVLLTPQRTGWPKFRIEDSKPLVRVDDLYVDELPDTPAHVAMRECLEKGLRLPLNEGIALETELFMQLVGTDESLEKIEAFFKK